MTCAATVLIPTHDHGPTLLHSIASARGQTVRDLEVLVVGDGAPAGTGERVAAAAEGDPRVRWIENPKGPRHGELFRHAALQEARGEIVCYLSDDDLWAPDHVESLRALEQQAIATLLEEAARSEEAARTPPSPGLLHRIGRRLGRALRSWGCGAART